MIFILGAIVVSMSGRSLTLGVGLEGGLVRGLAVMSPRIFWDERPEITAGSSPGAWEGGWRSAVQMTTVPSTEPVANLGCEELWSHATLVNAERPLV